MELEKFAPIPFRLQLSCGKQLADDELLPAKTRAVLGSPAANSNETFLSRLRLFFETIGLLLEEATRFQFDVVTSRQSIASSGVVATTAPGSGKKLSLKTPLFTSTGTPYGHVSLVTRSGRNTEGNSFFTLATKNFRNGRPINPRASARLFIRVYVPIENTWVYFMSSPFTPIGSRTGLQKKRAREEAPLDQSTTAPASPSSVAAADEEDLSAADEEEPPAKRARLNSLLSDVGLTPPLFAEEGTHIPFALASEGPSSTWNSSSFDLLQ